MGQTRRGFLGLLGVGVSSAFVPVHREAETMIALGNRTHILARPSAKEQLKFTTVLGCGAPVQLEVPGIAEPILAFRFPNGGSLSVEFTQDALDEQQARRGAWLELRTDDPAALTKKVLEAGLPQVNSLATDRFYFVAPGGQVLGIVAGAV
jgi:hypothetical protein